MPRTLRQMGSVIELSSSSSSSPEPPARPLRRTRSQGPPTPRASARRPSAKSKANASKANGKSTHVNTGPILGPVIELTDSEDDAEMPVRLAPKPSQGSGSMNAVASGSGLRHSGEVEVNEGGEKRAEEVEVEIEVRLAPKLSQGSGNAVASGSRTRHSDDEGDVHDKDTEHASDEEVVVEDYDPVFAAKPFPFDEAFFSASQKTQTQKPRQETQSQPVAGPSRIRPPFPAPAPPPLGDEDVFIGASTSTRKEPAQSQPVAGPPRMHFQVPVQPPFSVDDPFSGASARKIPGHSSQPVASSSRAGIPTSVMNAKSPVRFAPYSMVGRAAHTPRLLAELDDLALRVDAAEKATEKAAKAPVITLASVAPPAPVTPPSAAAAPEVLGAPVILEAAPVDREPSPIPLPRAVVAAAAPIPAAALPSVAAAAPAPAPAPVPTPAPIPAAAPPPGPAPAPVQPAPAPVQPAPAPIQALAPVIPANPAAQIAAALAQVLEVLPDIDRAYLDRILRANIPLLGAETGPRLLYALVEDGNWPKAAVVVPAAPASQPVVPAVVPPQAQAAPAPAPAPAPAQPPLQPAPAAVAPANIADDDEALIQQSITQVLSVLPDIERAYLERSVRAFVPQYGAESSAHVLNALVERGDWPKQAVGARVGGSGGAGGVGAGAGVGVGVGGAQGVQGEGANVKGKGRAMDDAEEAGEAKRARIDYENIDRPFEGGVHYTEVALIHLQCAFPYTPKNHLRHVLTYCRGHFAPTYLYLHSAIQPRGAHRGLWQQRAVQDDGAVLPTAPPGFDKEYLAKSRAFWDRGYMKNKTRFDARRKDALIKGRRDEALEAERRWVEERLAEAEARAGAAIDAPEAPVSAVDKGKGKARAVDEQLPNPDADADEQNGEGIECQCCFADYPFTEMVQCPEAHLFCTSCITTYASTQLASSCSSLLCMHSSGCALPFPFSELCRALPSKLLELYERVTAAKAVEEAGLEGLEGCPFCEWQCVMEVGGEEKLFRCGNTERCGVVSCRGCKKKNHLPKSCEEVEAEKHLDGRHAIEEAMTAALMRNCPKCKKPFIKEQGCNKMICPNCRTMSCYVCRKAITGYEHFNQNQNRGQVPLGQGSSNAKCLLWDEVEARHAADVKAAAEKATKEYREAHPEVDEAAIKVDVPVAPPKPALAPAPQVPLFGAVNVPAVHAQFMNYFPNPFAQPPVVPPIQRPQPPPPLVVPNVPAARRRGREQAHAAVAMAMALPPVAQVNRQAQAQAQVLEQRRRLADIEARERQAREAAVRKARKEERREMRAAQARFHEAVEAQRQALEAQREHGRAQMVLAMHEEMARAEEKAVRRRAGKGR